MYFFAPHSGVKGGLGTAKTSCYYPKVEKVGWSKCQERKGKKVFHYSAHSDLVSLQYLHLLIFFA